MDLFVSYPVVVGRIAKSVAVLDPAAVEKRSTIGNHLVNQDPVVNYLNLKDSGS